MTHQQDASDTSVDRLESLNGSGSEWKLKWRRSSREDLIQQIPSPKHAAELAHETPTVRPASLPENLSGQVTRQRSRRALHQPNSLLAEPPKQPPQQRSQQPLQQPLMSQQTHLQQHTNGLPAVPSASVGSASSASNAAIAASNHVFRPASRLWFSPVTDAQPQG